mgnify:CR=1 FL=1
MARMKIFNTLEQAAFDSPPVFNSVERKQFFALPLILKDVIIKLRTPTNKVCFLATVGYFKARRKFFAGQVNVADIEYIARQLNVSPTEVDVSTYTKFACHHHQRIILDYFGCRPFDVKTVAFAKSEIAILVAKNIDEINQCNFDLYEVSFIILSCGLCLRNPVIVFEMQNRISL